MSLEKFIVSTLRDEEFTARTREEVIAYMEATEMLTDLGRDLEREIGWDARHSLDWAWVLRELAPDEDEEEEECATSEAQTDDDEE